MRRGVPFDAATRRERRAVLAASDAFPRTGRSCLRSQQLIEPKAPLALRLAAVLMRGVVQLYSRQLFFLSGAPLALLMLCLLPCAGVPC
jgi:hypothetical protein